MKTNDNDSEDQGLSKVYREIAPYAGLGLQLAVTVGVMILLGVWLDGFLKVR